MDKVDKKQQRSDRRLSREDYLRLKRATQNQIACCGGLEAAARTTRVGKSELSNYQSPHQLERFIPIDVAADLTVQCGSLEIAGAIAAMAGAGIVPLVADANHLKGEIIEFAEYAAATFRDYALLEQSPVAGSDLLDRLDRDLQHVVGVAMKARENIKAMVRGRKRPGPAL